MGWGGNRGERFADVHHVYSADLDLFGEGSLFELLCAARTQMGEETLAGWLLAPAAVAEIGQRQAGVRELRARLDLRERINTLGSEREPILHRRRLLAWAEAPAALHESVGPMGRILAPRVIRGALVAGSLTGIWTPILLVLTLEAITLYRLREPLQQVLFPAERAFDFDGLKTFAGLLLRDRAGKVRLGADACADRHLRPVESPRRPESAGSRLSSCCRNSGRAS